ncbi:MAG: hypothetical protein LBH68_08095 [Bifidobacteriaceae bacterium]|nr:hypothetical protein [Bifidobacteriaceae bacterium]
MPQPIWMTWPLGVRVTIRRRLPEGGYADSVGVLEQATADEVAVRHKSGTLRHIPAAEIAIAHLIRPVAPPTKVPRSHPADGAA